MEIGIRLNDTLPGRFWDRLGYAREQGFNCVHLSPHKVLPDFDINDAPARLDGHLASQIRTALKMKGMRCAALGCDLALTTQNEAALQHTLDIYRAHLRFAPMLGVEVVGTGSVPDHGLKMEIHSEDVLQLFIRNLAPAVRWAEEYGATLAIEPAARQVVSTAERAERVLEALPSEHLAVVLDPVNLLTCENMQRADDVLEDALRRLGDRVRVVHVKDFAANPAQDEIEFLACGSGAMRYDRLLRFAAAHGLPLILENTRPDNAEAARRWIQAQWTRLNRPMGQPA